jgi:hypothetical protein
MMIYHPCVPCPECDDIENSLCPKCEGTGQHCPVCDGPGCYCEYPSDGVELLRGDEFDDEDCWLNHWDQGDNYVEQ